MKDNRTSFDLLDCIQVQWTENHLPNGDTETLYLIGWGKDNKLQGDEMTREELSELHRKIGIVLDEGNG